MVGVLFDQNVTRNRAVFVNWFGIPAATTKAVGMAVLRCRPHVLVAGLISTGHDRYEMHCTELNFDVLCENSSASEEEKIRRITEEVVVEYEKLILQYPQGWFWMHRRWKTRPTEEDKEDFYD